MDAIRDMQLGQVVDFVIAYNERQERAEKQTSRKGRGEARHRATQSEINAFFG